MRTETEQAEYEAGTKLDTDEKRAAYHAELIETFSARPMTVIALITQLQQYPPNSRVWHMGRDDVLVGLTADVFCESDMEDDVSGTVAQCFSEFGIVEDGDPPRVCLGGYHGTLKPKE